MEIMVRPAVAEDLSSITQIFYDTINNVNTTDYNANQVAAWSAGHANTENWLSKIAEQYFFVAVRIHSSGGRGGVNEEIVGFSSVTSTGYLDFMFVHHRYQGKGIARKLLAQIEQTARGLNITELTTHASITARPFFGQQDFVVEKQQTVNVRSVDLVNFVMRKDV